MRRRTRHLSALVAAQIACVGVGLWMHHRFVISSTIQKLEERTWTQLESELNAMVAEQSSEITGPGGDRPSRHLGFMHGAAEDEPARIGFLWVDETWRVTHPQNAPVAGQSADWPSILSWTPVEQPSGTKVGDNRGTIFLPDGVHLAVARPMRDGPGRLIAHRAKSAGDAEAAALLGSLPAVGGLTFVWTSALLGIAVYVITARFHDTFDRERSRSATETIRQAQQLVRARDSVIFGLAKLAESRDTDTGDHLERITVYSTTLAAALRRHPKFVHEATPAFVQLIGISSALHDIGKVGVEDRILRKPGALTADERIEMQRHATIGGECLREIEQRLGGSNFLQMAREIAFCHHEHWDGAGYPNGVAGEAIPLAARIVAVTDIYDALSSRRVYKDRLPHEKCVELIRKESGKKLDPGLVEVWLTVESKFREIAARFTDDHRGRERQRPLPFASQADVLGETEELCAAATDRAR